MAGSKVDICNLALTSLGQKRITSLVTNDEDSARCNAIFDDMRDELMASFPWSFATTRASLSQLAETPEYEFDYQYQLPTNLLRLLEINEVDIGSVNHKVEGRKLLLDESSVKIKYIKRETDIAKYTPGFITSLAARLAAELAFSYTASSTASKGYYDVYLQKLNEAIQVDSQGSGRPNAIRNGSWIISRGYNVFKFNEDIETE